MIETLSSDMDERGRFERDVLEHVRPLRSLARRLVGDLADADDLVQETYVRAFRSWRRFQPGTNCRAWLTTILLNTHRSLCSRRSHREVPMDPAQLEETQQRCIFAGSDGQQSRGVIEEIEDALGRCPPSFSEAVRLVDLKDLTYDEAARLIGCPVGTVRSRLYRGRSWLERELERDRTAELL